MNIITALLNFKRDVPNMQWHLEGDQLVIRVWLVEEDAELLRQGRRMFAPR